MDPLQNHGVLVILSFRGRRGLQDIKSTLLKENSKGPLGRASDGLKISIPMLFMGNVSSSLLC